MINCTTYYFENLKHGYFQYPFDSVSDQFKSYLEHFDCDSQIVFHRQPNNLVYYTYMHKLSSGEGKDSFGISVVINGLETKSINSLFTLFERVFQRIVSDGVILTINSAGDIVPKGNPFSSYATHFDSISAQISEIINEGRRFFDIMLPVNYSAIDTEYECVSVLEGDSKVKERLNIFNLLYITKNNQSNSSELNGLALRIENLNQQLDYLREQNKELEKNISGQTMSWGWKYFSIILIILLGLLIFGLLYGINCGIVTFSLS